jgi:hypothetical protein
MELKERSNLKTVWGLDPALLEPENGFDAIQPIEFNEAELPPISLPTALPKTVFAEAVFLPDNDYIELNQRYEAQLQATLEALKAAARRSRPQPAIAPKPAPAQAAPANPTKPATRPRARNALILTDSFKGTQFPTIQISGIPEIHYEMIRDVAGLEKAVEALKDEPVLAVDTETSGLDPYEAKLLLVQVSAPGMCYIIDAVKVPLDTLKPLLENEASLKLLQNAKFDYKMLKQQSNIELKNLYDTMLAERLLTAGLGFEVNLAAITKRYLGEIMDKSVRKTFYGQTSLNLSPEQLTYAAKDALALFPIYALQLEKLKQEK